MIRIYLGETRVFTLIIPHTTGVIYSRQVGGISCTQKETEGFIIPITDFRCLTSNKPIDANKCLEEFWTTKWGMHCYSGIDEETANFMDELLHEPILEHPLQLSVDRSRLAESMEAWVHMKISYSCEDRGHIDLLGKSATEAILTWVNSD
ncbi:MAG: DUF6210 family protein [Alphaproteobacteria bacterium]